MCSPELEPVDSSYARSTDARYKKVAEVYLGTEPLLGRAYRTTYSVGHWFASDEQMRADAFEGRFGWSTAVRLGRKLSKCTPPGARASLGRHMCSGICPAPSLDILVWVESYACKTLAPTRRHHQCLNTGSHSSSHHRTLLRHAVV